MNDVYIGTLIPVSQFLDANSHAIKIGDNQVTELKKIEFTLYLNIKERYVGNKRLYLN